MIDTKECRKCQEVLPASSYKKRASAPDGLQSYCYECQKADNRSRWGASPEWKRQDVNLRRRYRISQTDYRIMSDAQCNTCLICMAHESVRPLVVDHCHDTGEIRGLLCAHCNQGIGFLGDGRDLEVFKNALEYLK